MKKFMYFLIGINFITLAAHCSRAGIPLILSLVVLAIPFILLYKKRISVRIIQAIMVLAGFEWIRTAYSYILQRMESGDSWIRLMMIIGFVSIFCFWSVYLLNSKSIVSDYK